MTDTNDWWQRVVSGEAEPLTLERLDEFFEKVRDGGPPLADWQISFWRHAASALERGERLVVMPAQRGPSREERDTLEVYAMLAGFTVVRRAE